MGRARVEWDNRDIRRLASLEPVPARSLIAGANQFSLPLSTIRMREWTSRPPWRLSQICVSVTNGIIGVQDWRARGVFETNTQVALTQASPGFRRVVPLRASDVTMQIC